MAEYIDKEKLKIDFDDKAYYISHGRNNVERGMTLNGINQMIDEQQPADVVERVEYNKLLEENKALKECITIITNEQLRTAFKIKDLMKEIKKLQEQTRWTEEGLNEWSRYQSILHILKKIEENK